MFDVIIIGGGPAGVTAALYLKRLKKNILILTNDQSTLLKAHIIDNYYGMPNIDGKALYDHGIRQALELGISVLKEEVLEIEKNDNFIITTVLGKYEGKSVIIATGASRTRSSIKNLDDFEGRGVSYCATCDGFFYKDKKVAVIGNGEYALLEARHLFNVTKDVTIYTNGLKPTFEFDIPVVTDVISSISKEESFSLMGNNEYKADGIFVALGVASASSFAKKLGLLMNGNYLEVNENFETYIPGLYAIGDCIGGFLQIGKAVYEGSLVSTHINKYLKGVNND